jgi:hypothetical protein
MTKLVFLFYFLEQRTQMDRERDYDGVTAIYNQTLLKNGPLPCYAEFPGRRISPTITAPRQIA